MLAVTHEYKRGTAFSVLLKATGERDCITDMKSQMRYARYLATPVSDALPVSAEFSVSETEDGWLFSIDGATSEGLALGIHFADARFLINGAPDFTTTYAIRITEPVTEVTP
jgi:hypothetical protein